MSNNPPLAPLRRVGIIGWRGMVGSVLLQRMSEEGDFDRAGIEYSFFSTTQGGQPSPIAAVSQAVCDARDIEQLRTMDCLLSCQGSAYTEEIHPRLRASGWNGYWIDAASSLRLEPSSTLVLDVVNHDLIVERVQQGCKDFIGANCTVSLMMMAIWGLLRSDLVEWIYASTYQSASGAGAAAMGELLEQMGAVGTIDSELPKSDILQRASASHHFLCGLDRADSAFSAPLCTNVIPWIDTLLPESGQSREEWKAQVECNAILGHRPQGVAIEGICVRVPVLRCHSQSLLIRLRSELDADSACQLIAENPWVDLIENTPEASAAGLHPLAVDGSLRIKVGRVRQPFAASQPGHFLQLFTVGDQLLWGAAEPLRRMLAHLIDSD